MELSIFILKLDGPRMTELNHKIKFPPELSC